MTKQGLLVVISGPSGTGKGTVCQKYLEDNPDTVLSISMTTRSPREGEVEGKNYFFRDTSTFEKMIEDESFLEYARVYGNYYGTPKSFVLEHLESGRDVILEIDIQGALEIKERFKEGVFIFIAPPSMEELKRRIIGRGTETEEEVERRFSSSHDEIKFVTRYNYLVINDNVEDAVQEIESIVTAEKCKISRNKDFYTKLQGGI